MLQRQRAQISECKRSAKLQLPWGCVLEGCVNQGDKIHMFTEWPVDLYRVACRAVGPGAIPPTIQDTVYKYPLGNSTLSGHGRTDDDYSRCTLTKDVSISLCH